jgi:hypothetical protein
MKKSWMIFIVVVVILVLIGGFFLLQNKNVSTKDASSQPSSQDKNLDPNTFSSCQASTLTTPFGPGSYIIKVIGIENGNCHWQLSLQMPQGNQTKDCNYPLEQMSNNAFSHLFGGDKTGTGCLSDVCKQQESLQIRYCKEV